ncbi:LysR family transcriptional regulator substrate-binding protein [Paenibacillus sp. M1]|uniref:LysR family transcriptional regulator substrate-binding protein n=1 Tax=Paenibacillus haidiansis TaxID=1574488 RepID=A0ABU7VQ87_9BACL
MDHSADIAIVCGEAYKEPGLNYVTLLEDKFVFIVHRNHALAGSTITFEELMKETFILREEGSYTRRKLLSLCDAHETPKPRASLSIEGMYETIEAVKVGYGISLA